MKFRDDFELEVLRKFNVEFINFDVLFWFFPSKGKSEKELNQS